KKDILPGSQREAKAVESIVNKQLLQQRGETPAQRPGRIGSLVDREIERWAAPGENISDGPDDPRVLRLLEKVITGLEKKAIPAGSGREKGYVGKAARNWLIDERRKMDTRQRRRENEQRRTAKPARDKTQRHEYARIVRRLVAMLHPELVP